MFILKPQLWLRLFNGGALAIFVAVVFGFGTLFLNTYREWGVFKVRHQRDQQRLSVLKANITAAESYLSRLLNSPDFFEHVVRQRLGYARADEWIFKFREGRISRPSQGPI